MNKHDIVIIGGGPGGYVAAIRAAQLGFDVALVEKEKTLGGTCVRVGCIPSKALLVSSELYEQSKNHLSEHGISATNVKFDLKKILARKDSVVKSNTDGLDYLFKKNKIKRYLGSAEIIAKNKIKITGPDAQELGASNIIIATGSKVAPLKGVELDGKIIGTSTEALSYTSVPKHLVVIGAGVIGLELGSVWRRLGAKVTVLEYLDRILPGTDAEIAKEALKAFKKQGIEFKLSAKVTSAKVVAKKALLEIEGQEPIKADKVLLATGRLANTDGLGLDNLDIKTERGRIIVNDKFQTNIDNIYAIGDVIAGPMLAHKAEEDGVACAEILKTGVAHVNYDIMPAITYTEPEIASVGKTEEELNSLGINYKKGVFPYMANGRARAFGSTTGKVKVLADATTDRILGVHIIGHQAGDLIAEAVAAMAFGASSEDIARTVHAHPTLSEILKEACLAVDDRAIHI